jgi:TfoX N-terminal domain
MASTYSLSLTVYSCLVDGKMCISAEDNKIMCRIDPLLHEKALEKKGASTVVMRGREYRGFVYVTEEGIESKKDFDFWVGLALDFNKKAKASPKKKKK